MKSLSKAVAFVSLNKREIQDNNKSQEDYRLLIEICTIQVNCRRIALTTLSGKILLFPGKIQISAQI
jgi:hypothetical protein